MGTRGRAFTAVAAVLTMAFALPGAAHATFPGANGKIAFATNRDDTEGNLFDIWSANPDGSGQQRLTDDPADDTEPAYSADGSKIVFTRGAFGAREIWVMDADGSNETRLTDNSVADFQPGFSPDGSKIVFVSARPGDLQYRAYTMNPDGSGQAALSPNNGLDFFAPSFSPDGSKIVFTSFDGETFTYQVFVMGADGTGRTRLTETVGGHTASPEFSPDGSTIIFQRVFQNIWSMDADGSDELQLTNLGQDDSPTFSPDGTKLVVSRGVPDRVLATTNPDGSGPLPIVSSAGTNVQPDWQPIPIPAGPVTRTVDDDKVQCPTAAYTTIQAAVDAAGPGDTINVCRGTYTENVTIGAGKNDLSLISSTAPVAAVVKGESPFSVTGGVQGVSIQKFRIEPTGVGITVGLGSPSSAALIRSNVVVGGHSGLVVAGGDGGTVRDNMFNGQSQAAVSIASLPLAGASADVMNNTVIGGAGNFLGIVYSGVAGAPVSGLAFANTVWKIGGAGISINQATVAVKANSVSASEQGLRIQGTAPVIAENNKLTSNFAEGILVESGGHTLTSNNAKSNGGVDCKDTSQGTKTAGTANTWTANYGLESSPVGICKKN